MGGEGRDLQAAETKDPSELLGAGGEAWAEPPSASEGTVPAEALVSYFRPPERGTTHSAC